MFKIVDQRLKLMNVFFLQANVNKLDQKRRLRFEKMDKIFHDLEVVPLFGDMQVLFPE